MTRGFFEEKVRWACSTPNVFNLKRRCWKCGRRLRRAVYDDTRCAVCQSRQKPPFNETRHCYRYYDKRGFVPCQDPPVRPDISQSRVKAFLADIQLVFEKHQLTIGHQDDHGGFVIEDFCYYNIAWLEDASVCATDDPVLLPAPNPCEEDNAKKV